MKFTKTEDIDVTYMGENFEMFPANASQPDLGFGISSSYIFDPFPVRIRYQTFTDGKGKLYNLIASEVPSDLLRGQEFEIEKHFLSIFGKVKITLGKEKLKAKI
jgi:hypothetical protein